MGSSLRRKQQDELMCVCVCVFSFLHNVKNVQHPFSRAKFASFQQFAPTLPNLHLQEVFSLETNNWCLIRKNSHFKAAPTFENIWIISVQMWTGAHSSSNSQELPSSRLHLLEASGLNVCVGVLLPVGFLAEVTWLGETLMVCLSRFSADPRPVMC